MMLLSTKQIFSIMMKIPMYQFFVYVTVFARDQLNSSMCRTVDTRVKIDWFDQTKMVLRWALNLSYLFANNRSF